MGSVGILWGYGRYWAFHCLARGVKGTHSTCTALGVLHASSPSGYDKPFLLGV